MARKVYYGRVQFVRESEPHMTISMAGVRPETGVIVADINLKFIWDVVSEIGVGDGGQAYVVDAEDRLIAHPVLSFVLRNTNMSQLAQVRAARDAPSGRASAPQLVAADSIQGWRVLTSHVRVDPLNWLVFVELPVDEAYAPLYASINRSITMLLGALVLAFLCGLFLARRMTVPIGVLRDGAARIGSGDLAHRISIKSGDELEALGSQFNSMATQLQDLYSTLERKVEERTQQLEVANQAKSRFLAAASHDLRQPLHAVSLFVAQLRNRLTLAERRHVVERIEAALTSMNDLFNALLDISKIDAGALTPEWHDFPMMQVLNRIATTFAEAAWEAGLSLRIVPTTAWVRSDFILLERILLNLVSNALRYTSRGGVIVGCRRRGFALRIEVWDTGAGIPDDQHQKIFGEFYRLGEPDRDHRAGLGLGLAIVDRLGRLLNHPIELASTLGKGSRFAISVPLAAARPNIAGVPAPIRAVDATTDKLILVIDDDPLVLDGMDGLFRGWGYRLVAGDSCAAALTSLEGCDRPPDLIICDYRLPDGKTGIETINSVRSSCCSNIPAFLVSGDTNPEPLQEARASGYHLLHKPVDPMRLRAMLSQMLKKGTASHAQ
jgi:signal transduction histidine kinase